MPSGNADIFIEINFKIHSFLFNFDVVHNVDRFTDFINFGKPFLSIKRLLIVYFIYIINRKIGTIILFIQPK